MSGQKVLTADQLMVLAGLDKSPDKIARQAQEHYEKKYRSITNPSVARRVLNRYIGWRLKDLTTDASWLITLMTGLTFISIPVQIIVSNIFPLPAGVSLSACIHILCLFARSKDNIQAMQKTSQIDGSVATHCKSWPHQMWFMLRNSILSPLDLFLLREKKLWDDQGRKEVRIVVEPFDSSLPIRKAYVDGLKRVEDELIGPNSDWSKSFVDLKARLEKTIQLKKRIIARIKQAKSAGDDVRYEELESARVRLISTERGLNEAIASITLLVEKTQAELNKLYDIVDGIGDVFQDAELIREADALIDAGEAAIDHAQLLQTQAYEKISRQLMAVASVVISHKLLPNPKVEAIDMPRYLEDIEKAATAIVKIGEV